MSDLSRLLEDVYRSGPAAPAAPSWSSDSALEEVFADWVPGPSEDAHAAQRAFAPSADDRAETMDQLDVLMQQAAAMAPEVVDDEPMVEAIVELPRPVIELEPAPEPIAVVPTRTWCRQDDDILPSRGHGRRRRKSRR